MDGDFYSHSIRIAQTDLSFTDVNCTNPPHVLPIWINKHEHTRSNRIETDGRTYWNKTKKRTQFNVKSRMSFPINVTVHTLCLPHTATKNGLFIFISIENHKFRFCAIVVYFFLFCRFLLLLRSIARTVFLDNNFFFSFLCCFYRGRGK